MNKLLMVMGCAVTMAALSTAQNKATVGDTGEMTAFRRPLTAGMNDGDFPMMQVQFIKELGLSKEQQQQIKDIRSGDSTTLMESFAKKNDAVKRQIDLMSQDVPNESDVMKSVDEISGISRDIAKIRIKQVLGILNVLTPEQRTKMREKMKARMKERFEKHEQSDRRKGDGQRKEHAKPDHAPVPPQPKAE